MKELTCWMTIEIMGAKTRFVEVEGAKAKIAFKPMWCCLLSSQAEYIIQKKYKASSSKWYCNFATKSFLFWSSLLIA